MGLSHYVSFTSQNARGYFANWAHQQGALGLLVEFTNSSSVDLGRLIGAVDSICASGSIPEKDDRFSRFDSIRCYTLSKDRVTTYKYFNEAYPGQSYIDGETDEVIIHAVYANGWAKVEYPIINGRKVAYCPMDRIIPGFGAQTALTPVSVAANTNVYLRSDLSERYGTVKPADEAYIVCESGNAEQIIYKLNDDGWGMGWIGR